MDSDWLAGNLRRCRRCRLLAGSINAGTAKSPARFLGQGLG